MSESSTYLDRLPEAVRRSLLDLGHARSFVRGQHLVREGASNDHVIVITAGWAKIATVTLNGVEVLLAVRGPGELVGEMAALDDPHGARSASVQALTALDATLVDAGSFVTFLETHPAGSLALLREFIRRLRETSSRAVRHGTLDVRRHLAEVLLDLSSRVGHRGHEEVVIDVGLTQADLAGMLSCSRDSVAKALVRLRSEGCVRTSRRSITVVSRSRLEQLAHESS